MVRLRGQGGGAGHFKELMHVRKLKRHLDLLLCSFFSDWLSKFLKEWRTQPLASSLLLKTCSISTSFAQCLPGPSLLARRNLEMAGGQGEVYVWTNWPNAAPLLGRMQVLSRPISSLSLKVSVISSTNNKCCLLLKKKVTDTSLTCIVLSVQVKWTASNNGFSLQKIYWEIA